MTSIDIPPAMPPRQTVISDLEQRTFRALLDAMARPGTIRVLPASPGAEGPWATVLTVMQSLLDHEVTFCVEADDRSVHEQILRRTGARSASLDQADFVVTDAAHAAATITAAREGDLEAPERSATVIVRADHVGEGATQAVLSGPGIASVVPLALDGVTAEALRALVERNAAFPNGIDTVFVDTEGRVTCLPRSTRIELED